MFCLFFLLFSALCEINLLIALSSLYFLIPVSHLLLFVLIAAFATVPLTDGLF